MGGSVRVCMVTTFYPPHNFGGDGLFVQQLSRGLVDAGHEVEVVHCTDAWRVVSGRSEPEQAEAADDGVVVHRLRSRLGKLSPLITQQSGLQEVGREGSAHQTESHETNLADLRHRLSP